MPEAIAVRKIEIDAGHRIPDHNSKCKNLHGHRYTIELHVTGPLIIGGPEKGMVKDFSLLKKCMMNVVDKTCDHGLMLSIKDPLLQNSIIYPKLNIRVEIPIYTKPDMLNYIDRNYLAEQSYWAGDSNVGKLFIMAEPPTAENLAKVWHTMLEIELKNNRNLKISKIVVYETPNCWAEYRP